MNQVMCKQVLLPNGETMGYRERSGGTELLILIHGNMTSSKHWDVLMEKLHPRFHVIAVDLRGFGMSSYHQRITSLRDLSEDLKQFADLLGLDSFHLMGWSTGGGVAMQFAADYPSLVKQCVLLASASTRGYPFYTTDSEGKMTRCLTIEEVEQDPTKTIPVQQAYDSKNKSFLRYMWDSLIYTHRQPLEKKYEEYLEDMCTQRNLADIYQALNIFNISHESNGIVMGTGDVERIQCPVLVLWGERDYVVTRQMTDEILADLGSRATLVTLADCGHSPPIDQCEQLIIEIEKFLQ